MTRHSPLLVTIGAFQLERGQQVVLRAGKPLAVLLVLLRTPGRRAPREQLLSLLWADAPPARRRQSLRQALLVLREALGAEAISTTGDNVALVADVALDVDEEVLRARQGDAASLQRLRQLPFVPAFDPPGSAGFVAWCQGESEAISRELGHGQDAPLAPMPAPAEHRTRWPWWGAAAAVAGLFVVGAAIASGSASDAVGLALAASPIAAPGDGPFVPAPVVEVIDARGRRLDVRLPVTATLLTPDHNLAGTATQVTVDGRATFGDLRLSRAARAAPYDSIRVRFQSPRLAPVTFTLPREMWGDAARHGLYVREVRLHGNPVDPAAITAVAGDTLVLDLVLNYSSPWPAASVILGAWPSWMPRQAPLTVHPLLTPALGRLDEARLAIAAPQTPGNYHIVLAFHAEDRVANFFSGTNWILGEPRWNDGNDVADWGERELASARAQGGVWMQYATKDGSHTREVAHREWLAAAVLDVRVIATR